MAAMGMPSCCLLLSVAALWTWGAGGVAVFLAAVLILNVATHAVGQMWLNRRVLRGAAQPRWGRIYNAMPEVHRAFGFTARCLVPVTMRLSARLWPPSGTRDRL